jgi:dTDP-4-dehydrorhamnose reductase
MREKIKILIIGGSGLVGSRIAEFFHFFYEIDILSTNRFFDVRDAFAVFEKIARSPASIVLHLAAKADVEECEKDKISGKKGVTWEINVEGVRNVSVACETNMKKLIYISTDFVFGGREAPEDGFTEEDVPYPVNWYGQTKYEAEKIVQHMKTPWLIARISYPYRANFYKKDFVRTFLMHLQQREPLKLITDHLMSPTFIDDIAFALCALIQQNETGVYHITGSQCLSPYEAGLAIAKIFNIDKTLVGQTTRIDYFKGFAIRPFNLSMNNSKTHKLGIAIRTFDEGLKELKRQIETKI